MKFMLIQLTILIFIAGCGIDFTSHYDRIEESRVRTLAIIYDNNGVAEGAPGDTVQCAAYFAGEQVSSVDWTVATALIINQFGRDTFADTVSLDRYMVPGSYHEYSGGTTDSIRFSFILPHDLIRSQISDTVTIADMLPAGFTDSLLPESARMLTPSSLIDLVELFSGGVPPVDTPVDVPKVLPDSVLKMLPVLLQVFTVNMKLFARINGKYRVESTFTVRYNSRLHRAVPQIPVNRNPVIEWIRCYRVREERVVFNPLEDGALADTVFNVFPDRDTILVDVGYHYFFVADSGTRSLDSSISLSDATQEYRPEEYVYEWFYQNGDSIPGKPFDSLMLLENAFRGTSVSLLPSLDVRMRNFNLWLVTYDSFLGEKFRPVGFSLQCMQGVFTYTDAYRKRYGP